MDQGMDWSNRLMKIWVEQQRRNTSGNVYFGRLDISCGANHPSFRNPTSEVNIYPCWNSVSPPRTQCIPAATLSQDQTLAPLEFFSDQLDRKRRDKYICIL